MKTYHFPLMILTVLCLGLSATSASLADNDSHTDSDDSDYEYYNCPERSRSCSESSVAIQRDQRQRQAYSRKRTQKDKDTTVIVDGKTLKPKDYLKGNKIILKDIDINNKPKDWKAAEYSEGAIVIEAGKNIKQIILDDIKIHTRSGKNKSTKNQAPLVIRAQEAKKIQIHDVNIKAQGIDLYNIDNTYNECVGLMCIDAPKSDLKLQDIDLKSTGDNRFIIH